MGSLNQGLILMATGMLSVFSFLVILVFIVRAFEFIAPKIAFILPDPAPAKPKTTAAPVAAKNDAAIALAIAAAVNKSKKG